MESFYRSITESLLKSYHQVGGINRLDHSNLPSKRTIISACESLLQLLFPGYHDEEPVPADELEAITGERIATLMELLIEEIAQSLGEEPTTGSRAPLSNTHKARELVSQFAATLPAIRAKLQTDVDAAYDGDPAVTDVNEIILAYPFIEAIAIQRCAHELYRLGVPLIPRIMTEYAHNITGIDIHPGAEIGSHFFIDHGTGVVIGETCVVGDRVKLYHGVTLGARNFPKDAEGRVVKKNKRHPNVEDDVVIYPNATILGGETVIGKGSTIGANVFLSESVPPHSFVTNKAEELLIRDKGSR